MDGNRRFRRFWSKPRPGPSKRRGRGLLVNFLGAGAVALSALAMLVCCGFTGVASLAAALGLSVLNRTDAGLPILYGVLVANLMIWLWSARTHRRLHPALLGLAGAGLLYYVWNHALDVRLWLAIMYSGVALVLVASGLDLWLRWQCGAACQKPT